MAYLYLNGTDTKCVDSLERAWKEAKKRFCDEGLAINDLHIIGAVHTKSKKGNDFYRVEFSVVYGDDIGQFLSEGMFVWSNDESLDDNSTLIQAFKDFDSLQNYATIELDASRVNK